LSRHVTTLVGLRDRALIAVMTFAFARIGAVVAMRVCFISRGTASPSLATICARGTT
jgi:hypothetical protein